MYGIEGSFCFFFSQYSPCVNCFWIYQSQPFYLLLDVLPPPHFLLLKITAINTFISEDCDFFFIGIIESLETTEEVLSYHLSTLPSSPIFVYVSMEIYSYLFIYTHL